MVRGFVVVLPQALSAVSPTDMAPCLFDASVVHNPLTHNFQKLVLHVLELLSAAQAGRVSQSVANAVHLVACMLKYITETAPPSSLISIFESVPSLPQSVQGKSSITCRCCQAIALTVLCSGQHR